MDGKNAVLAEYLFLSGLYLAEKLHNVPKEEIEETVVSPLVFDRILLEKLIGLEGRYEHQIEKLLKVAELGRSSANASSFLGYKPHPDKVFAGLESRGIIFILKLLYI
jgi:hypothetical protein